ncbi:NAD(P)/FAD-dependent oxidoreductase [Actinocorallia longicatena]|uniref:NAD(P)/FAD-dependent oxidoreductase n=1 Tax=Actinocorallia longicatena TaxID=111803 RepID=A0ABP6QC73_9ACTN
MYDAVIVGARCAGAGTALLLAQRGYRVLLIDRAAFPSDTMSTLYIHPPGVALLARWGVLDEVVASGCPALDTITYDVGGLRLAAPAPATAYAKACYAPRRQVLDGLLVRAAVAAGAEFTDRTSAREPVWSDGRVTGVRVSRGDVTETVEARLVIGADGMNSRIAERVGAPLTRSDPLASCVYYSAWRGVETGFGYHERPGSWIARIPTHGDVTLVATYFPQDRFADLRKDPMSGHLAAIEAGAPELHDQVRAAEQAGRLMGTGNQQNFFRRPHGPGWALVGDAAHHLDTITARGITNALIQAQLIADAVAGQDFADAAGLDRRLARYGDELREVLDEPYTSTLELARLQVPDSRLTLLRTISDSPELVASYFAMIAGIIDEAEFFTPELLAVLPAGKGRRA